MLTINPLVTAWVVLITPLSLFVASFVARRTSVLFTEQSRIRAEQTALVDELIGSHKVVTAFSHEDEAVSDFDEVNGRLETVSRRATFYSSLTNPFTRFVNNLVYAGAALFGALVCLHPVSGMTLSVGMLSSFLSYASQYTKPFNEISSVITELQNALACAARLFELIEAPAEEPKAEAALAENEYVGTGVSEIGGEVKVKVTMDGDKIAKIDVLSHSETSGISDPAFELSLIHI